MSDRKHTQKPRKNRRNDRHTRTYGSGFVRFDAWVDSTLYRSKAWFADKLDRSAIVSQYFRVRGFRRFLVEVLDEGLTIGLIGLIVFVGIGVQNFAVTKNKWQNPENIAVTLYDTHGNYIGKRGALNSGNVTLDELPDYLVKSVLATEDRRFFEHWGIDFVGLGRALSSNVRANGVVQGGSTLTQQLAKNLFLTNERSIERKIREAYLAIWLEANLSKREILKLYLDRAYMGGGNFGIGAASQFYFDKDVRNVTLAEAAMLAGLFKAPGRYAPHINLPAARARANVVLSNLVESGYMSEGEVIGARRHPANIANVLDQDHPDYFLDWAFDEIRKMSDQLPEHTLIARTTLDMSLQKAAEESISYYLREYGRSFHVSQAAAVILDNDGAVRAIVGGRDYRESQFNRATQGLRQTGSSFKPYVYAIALESGLTPKSIVLDAPIHWGNWSPHNYGRSYSGRVDLTSALVRSLNTVPVRITYQNLRGSTDKIVALVKASGVETPISSHKTMVLGTSEMTVMDQATGFNVFANGGMAGNRHAFTQLLSVDGRVVWDWKKNAPQPRRILSEKAAGQLNSMMVQVVGRGTGRRAALPMTQVAGKTGTTNSYKDAWFVGFTGNYTAAVWMGNDNSSPMGRTTGGVVPAMMWQRMMLAAHQNVALKPIYGVPNSVLIASSKTRTSDSENTATGNLPQVLSPAATGSIRSIADKLRTATPLTQPIVDTYAASTVVTPQGKTQ